MVWGHQPQNLLKKSIIIVILLAIFINVPSTNASYNRNDYVLASKSWTKEKGLILVAKYAAQYKVSEDSIIKIINCENVDWDPSLQSQLRYTEDHPNWGVKKGQQELSFGLVQIHIPAHHNISIKQAKDPDFSIRFIAENISEGKKEIWSCAKT